MDAYIGLNSATRLCLFSSFNGQAGSWRGDFQGHVDFALKPVFRRGLREHDDVFNKRFLSFRAGFKYISSLGDAPAYLEHRWTVESTSRFPLPWKILVSDRSRGEFRFIHGQPFSCRYRNRLQLERDLAIGKFVYTPYVNAELFYDTRYDAWGQKRYSVGVQVPAGGRLVIDTYYLGRVESQPTSSRANVLGLKFQFYF